MTRYSLVVNKRGTILSFKVVDADPKLFPVKDMTGRHFSRLIGDDCRKDLGHILHEISRTRQAGSFRTFFSPRGSHAGCGGRVDRAAKDGKYFLDNPF